MARDLLRQLGLELILERGAQAGKIDVPLNASLICIGLVFRHLWIAFMPLTLVVSDTPITGEISQRVSVGSRSSYLCSIKYLILDESFEINDFEYDDYESFMEDENFVSHLICELEVRPTPFVFGKLDDLCLGVINDAGGILWSAEAGNLNGASSTSVTFDPESIEFEVDDNREHLSAQGNHNVSMREMNKIKIPQRGFLIKVYTYEEDNHEIPINLDGESFDPSHLVIVDSYGELFNEEPELMGFYWKGQPLEIYGQGGAGAFVEYSFFSLADGDACEIAR
ncbi:hypothetical protein [Synechococcus sp. UW140]|uniref:hypothetical protein n=1 Tax=Synechococcus sp. UW140 TaxID=368503 RepID=UPI003137C2E1